MSEWLSGTPWRLVVAAAFLPVVGALAIGMGAGLARLEARIGGYPATAYQYVFTAYRQALQEAYDNFKKRAESLGELAGGFAAFKRENADWLESDVLFEALKLDHGTDRWQDWLRAEDKRLMTGTGNPERIKALQSAYADVMEHYRFCQFVVHRQHADWKAWLADPEKHWKDGRSAKMLAESWEAADAPRRRTTSTCSAGSDRISP